MEPELPELQVERLEENQSVQASKGRGKRTKIANVLYKDYVLLTHGLTVKKLDGDGNGKSKGNKKPKRDQALNKKLERTMARNPVP